MGIEVFDRQTQDLTIEDARKQQLEIELAAKVANALHTQYPGHLWMVSVHGGVTQVKNLALEGLWGFILHNHKLVNEDIVKRARLAGGELLERFRISRGREGASQAQAFLHERLKAPVLKLPDWAR